MSKTAYQQLVEMEKEGHCSILVNTDRDTVFVLMAEGTTCLALDEERALKFIEQISEALQMIKKTSIN